MIRSDSSTQLDSLPALAHLKPEIMTALAEASRGYLLKAGEVLLYQGDLIRSFYMVQSGGVRLVDYTSDGQCVALKVYGRGDAFGLLAISGAYPSPTQIEAVHESQVTAIDGQVLRQMMLRYPELALTVVDLLAAHVHEGHERIRHMSAKRVDRRLAQSLLQLCSKFGKLEGDAENSPILIDAPFTQRDLAELINSTVETVNRTLTIWERQGILTCAHKRVRILQPDVLASIAENEYVEQANSA